MTTLGDLIATIHSSLHSYTGVHEQVTWLTAPVDTDDLILPVDTGTPIRRGVAEIDDELVYVTSSDTSSATLAPFGRGYKNTAAASHSTNAQVIYDPAFPKSEIRKAINDCIQGLFPTLVWVKSTDIEYDNSTLVGWQLPADCEGVIGVLVQEPGQVEDYWAPLSLWEFDPMSPETNGKRLNITYALLPGTDVRVNYIAKFGTFANDSSTLASVGLSESHADLILYGVTSRLIRFLDPSRLQLQSVENISRSQVVQAGDAGRLANQLYAMYTKRLEEERRRLLDLYPSRPNFLAR